MTGASGFVGSSLCAALSEKGHQVSRLSLKRSGTHVELGGAAVVVHLAAVVHKRAATSARFKRVNVELTHSVGRAAVAIGARMVFVSSVKVHGDESQQPLRGSSPLAPADHYALSKVEAEAALRSITGLQLVVLRPPLVYGPNVRANFLMLLNAIAWRLPLPLARVRNRRSFVYVGNLADAIMRCMHHPRAVGGTYLVSDGAALSTPALCSAIGAALDRPARFFAFPPALLPRALAGSLEIDDSDLRTQLDWRAPFSLEEGLRATAHWYRSR